MGRKVKQVGGILEIQTLCTNATRGGVREADQPNCASGSERMAFSQVVSAPGRLNLVFLDKPEPRAEAGGKGKGDSAPSPGSETPFQVCNQSDEDLRFATAWDADGRIDVAGWTGVAAGDCTEAALPIPYAGSFALHVEEYGDGPSLCVDPSEDFYIADGTSDCEDRGYELREFVVVLLMPGEDNTYTFR